MASTLEYNKQIPLVVPYKGKIFAPPRAVLQVSVPLGQNDGSKSAARYEKLFKEYFEANLKKLLTGPMLKRIADEMKKSESLVATEAKKAGGDAKGLLKTLETNLNEKLKKELDNLKGAQLENLIKAVRDKCQRLIVKEAENFVFDEKKKVVVKLTLGASIAIGSAAAGIAVGAATMGGGAPAAVIFALSTVAALAGTAKTLYSVIVNNLRKFNKYHLRVEKHVENVKKLEAELEKQTNKTKVGAKLNKKDKIKLAVKLTKVGVKKLQNDLDKMEKFNIVLHKDIAKLAATTLKLDSRLDEAYKKAATMNDPKAKAKMEKVVKQLKGKISDMDSDLKAISEKLNEFYKLHSEATKAIKKIEKDGDIDFTNFGRIAKAVASSSSVAENIASKGLAATITTIKVVDSLSG